MKELLIVCLCIGIGSAICLAVPVVRSIHAMHVETHNSDEFARQATESQNKLTTIDLKHSEVLLKDSIRSWK